VPEYPDIEVYIDALVSRLTGALLERIEVVNPFVLRTVDPPASAFADRALSRLLKRDWPRTIEALESQRTAGGGNGADTGK
jgi:hypothetical protein